MQWRRAARLTPPLTLLLMGQIIAVAVGAPLAFNELDHLGCVPRAAAPNAAGRRRWARMASCCILDVACCSDTGWPRSVDERLYSILAMLTAISRTATCAQICIMQHAARNKQRARETCSLAQAGCTEAR